MDSSESTAAEVQFYFHLLPADVPARLLILAGSGKAHEHPTIAIPASLFYYLSDTLRWIPTHNGTLARFPFERPVIESDGASAARTIFSAWLQLFGTAGNALTLNVGTAPSTGTLSFNKNNVMLVLSTLVQFSEEIASGANVIYCSDVPDYEGQQQDASERQFMIPATVGK